MKLLEVFRRNRTTLLGPSSAQDQAERLLAESFRMLGQVCAKMAEYVESQRLARRGYETQGKFLERLDGGKPTSGRPE